MNKMKSLTYLIAITALALLSASQTAYGWESCGQWANWEDGGYILYNNIWGEGAGEQCIWANSYSNWGVWADHPETSGVKSYPNSTLPDINTRISQLESLTSNFNCTVPSGGSYTTTYDIWSGRKKEIMLWMNKQGAVGPWADQYDEYGNAIPKAEDVTVGGHTWDFYYNGGSRGMHVYSFVRTSNTNAGTVDILAILNWMKNNGWVTDITIGYVQLGFEITSSAGGMDFVMNEYSVSWSLTPSTVPETPSDLSVTVAGPNALDLSWMDNSSGEDGFKIERSLTSGSGFSEIDTVGMNVTSYQDSGLETGTTYYYRVCAYNGYGDSGYSNEASGTPIQLGSGTGLNAEYSDDVGGYVNRVDATVDFDWGTSSPDSGIDTDNFYATWTGYVEPLYSETYTFRTFSDDADRLWVNGQQLIDDWKTQRAKKTNEGTIILTAGVKYEITLEFMEQSGEALCHLYWSSASQAEEIIPQSQLYTAP
jgi:hypothetical protein